MKSCPKVVEQILEAIKNARSICIVGHVRPDGDCIGSQIGLALALIEEGKDVTVWNEDPVPDKLRFLDPERLVRKPHNGLRFDAVIATDCASLDRLGRVAEHIADRGVFINIDHQQQWLCRQKLVATQQFAFFFIQHNITHWCALLKLAL